MFLCLMSCWLLAALFVIALLLLWQFLSVLPSFRILAFAGDATSVLLPFLMSYSWRWLAAWSLVAVSYSVASFRGLPLAS